MFTHATAPERVFRILTIVSMLLMLAVPAMAAPAAPTGTGDISTLTVHSPVTSAPFFVSFDSFFDVTFSTDGTGTGQAYYLVGGVQVAQDTAGTLNLPLTNHVRTLPTPPSINPNPPGNANTAGAYDVVVCVKGDNQGPWVCNTINGTNTGAPGNGFNAIWIGNIQNGFGQDILLTPQGSAESINAGSTYNVTWDAAAINAIFGNPPGGVTGDRIRLELWDATDYGTNNPSLPLTTPRICLNASGNPPAPANPPPSNGWGATNPGPYGPFANTQMILRAVYGPMANTGSYMWTVPEMLGSCFHMRLVFNDDGVPPTYAWDWTGTQFPLTPPAVNPDPTWGGRFKIIDFDQSAPVVTVDKPVANACVAGTIDLEATANDPDPLVPGDPGSGIDWVQFQVNSTILAPILHGVAATPLQTLFTTTSDTTQAPWGADGTPNTVRAWARNFAGVISWDEVSVTVDNSAADAATWNAPACGTPAYLKDTVTLSVNVADAHSGIDTVEFWWDPDGAGPALPVSLGFGTEDLPANPGTWTFDWDTTGFDNVTPPGGELGVDVTNGCGISYSQGVQWQSNCPYVVDNIAPVCADALRQPPTYNTWGDMEPWQIGQQRPFRWDAQAPAPNIPSDPNLGANPIDLWVSWDGQANWLQVAGPLPLVNAPVNAGGESRWLWQYVNGYPTTDWYAKLVVTDLAGNTCEDISDQFTVFGAENTQLGPTPPVNVVWTAPTAPPLMGTIPVAGTAWDPETSIWYVEFCYSPAGLNTWTCPVTDYLPDNFATAGQTGPFTFSGNMDVSALNGSYDFAVRAYNGVGMPTISVPVSDGSDALTVDNTPPTAFNMWPRSYQTVVGTYCPSWNALVDNGSGIAFSTFEYSTDGLTWLPTTPVNDGCLPGLPDSDSTNPPTVYQIKGTATDNATNVMNPPIIHTNIKISNQFPDKGVNSPANRLGYPIPLNVGWNLISLVQVPATPMIAEVLQDLLACNAVDKVYTFDNPTNAWGFKNYVLSTGGLANIRDGKGYWLLLNSNLSTCPVQFLWNVGIFPPRPPVAPPTYQAYANWNLLGVTSDVINPFGPFGPTVNAYFGTGATGPTAIYGYGAFGPFYYTPPAAGAMSRGAGFWVAYPGNLMIQP